MKTQIDIDHHIWKDWHDETNPDSAISKLNALLAPHDVRLRKTSGPLDDWIGLEAESEYTYAMNVIKALRDETGHTQKQFSAMVGCSLDAVKSIETGRTKIGSNLARRIHTATGVSDSALMDGRLLSATGGPYSRAFFDMWRQRFYSTATTGSVKYVPFTIICPEIKPGQGVKTREISVEVRTEGEHDILLPEAMERIETIKMQMILTRLTECVRELYAATGAGAQGKDSNEK